MNNNRESVLMNIRILLRLVCVVMLAGCSGAGSQPTKEQITSAIKQQLQPGLDIQDIRFKVFSDENGATGRIDIAGTLVTTEDRVQAEASQADRLYRMLMSAGATQNQVYRYMVNTGLTRVPGDFGAVAVFYEHRVTAGTPVNFTSELHYAETVDGYNFNGNVAYDICCDSISKIKQFQGLHLVYDMPEMQGYYEKLLALHKRETEAFPQLVEEYFSGLTKGSEVVNGEKVIARIGPIHPKEHAWAVANIADGNGRLFDAYTATVPATLELVSDANISGIGAEKGKVNQIRIELWIDSNNPASMNACLALRAGTGHGYGGQGCWNGSVWVADSRIIGGIYEMGTNKRLSVRPVESPEKVGVANTIEKPTLSIDDKVLGNWGMPGNPRYFEFHPDHTISMHMGDDISMGTWSIDKETIIMTLGTESLILAFKGDELVSVDTKSNDRLVKLDGLSELDKAKYIADAIASKVEEGLNLAGAVKLAVKEYLEARGGFPSVGGNSDANSVYGLPPENTISAAYVSGIAVLDSGVIRITYNENFGGAPSANGHTLLLAPTIVNNKIVGWDCSGGSMPDIYRPASCHKAEVNNNAGVQQQQKVEQDIRALEAALNLYKLDNYVYPTTDQGLTALVQRPSSPAPPNWKKGGYIDQLPQDPWQQPYLFLSPGKHGSIDIFSLGSDRVPSDDDIGNWELPQT